MKFFLVMFIFLGMFLGNANANESNDHLMFSGIARDIPKSQLKGWHLCLWSDNNSQTFSGGIKDTIRRNCEGGDKLLFACGPSLKSNGSDILTLAAVVSRVTALKEKHQQYTEENGLRFFHSPDQSIGFTSQVSQIIDYKKCNSTHNEDTLCWNTLYVGKCGLDEMDVGTGEFGDRYIYTNRK